MSGENAVRASPPTVDLTRRPEVTIVEDRIESFNADLSRPSVPIAIPIAEDGGDVPPGDHPQGRDCERYAPPGCRLNRRPVSNALSFPQKIVGGSGHILNDLCASMWFSYLLFYLEKVVGFSSTNAAALMLLGQIVDGLSTPLIGYEADRAMHCWLCKIGYGRCKAWHLVGVILVMVSFPFVFSPCIECEGTQEWAKAIYYAPFIAIFQIGWAASQISHLALIPKMNHEVLVRTELLAIRYGFTIASNVTVFLMTWYTLGFNSDTCEIDAKNSSTFRNLALVSVGVGGFFSILFHFFVVEQSDEEVKKTVSLIEANQPPDVQAERRSSNHSHKDILESLNNVTNIKSVASSMAISKVQAQARRRSRRRSSSKSEGEAGQSLLSSQDDMDDPALVIGDSHPPPYVVPVPGAVPSPPVPANTAVPRSNVVLAASITDVATGRYCTKSLNVGKDVMTVRDWLSLPQFYIVAIMYMSTRLSVNVTQVYMPLYVIESLHMTCSAIASVPLTMYCSGFIVALFIKLINKCVGRQFAYIFGALLCVIGACLVLFLEWTPGSFLVEKGIYGVAVLLGGGASAILVTSLSITADMIGNNVENGAFVYGAMSFCDKLSCGIVIMLINTLNPCQKEGTVDKACQEDVPFYINVLGYASGGCALIGVLGVIGLTYIIYLQNRRRDAELT